MNILAKLRLVSAHSLKCRPFALPPLKTVKFSYRWKATHVRLPSQSIVIANLCEKLKCTEIEAKNIYDKCPELRPIDAIQDDSFQILSKKLSLLSIIENPELMTMDFGNKMISFIGFQHFLNYFRSNCALDTLKRKIELLNTVWPKSLDDFAALLQMNEKELKTVVCKRMLNERHEVGAYGNRIYYLSEKLQVFFFHSH